MSANIARFVTALNAATTAGFSGPDRVINDARKNRYLWGRFLGEKSKTFITGGKSLRDTILLEAKGNWRTFDTVAKQSVVLRNMGDTWYAGFHEEIDEVVWSKREIAMVDDVRLKDVARRQKFKDIQYLKLQQFYTATINSRDDALMAVPNRAKMETSAATDQEDADPSASYSIPAFVNERTNGLFVSPAADGGTWTTVHGISSATRPAWRNKTATYTEASETSATVGVLAAMDSIYEDLNYEPLGMYSEWIDKASTSGGDLPKMPQFIATSKLGVTQWKAAMRANHEGQYQAMVASRIDGSIMPTFGGVEIVRYNVFDEAAVYDDGSSGLTTEDQADAAGPRYYFLDPNFMHYVFQGDEMIEKMEAMMGGIQYPGLIVQYFTSRSNLVCSSRQRHGIVYPVNAA